MEPILLERVLRTAFRPLHVLPPAGGGMVALGLFAAGQLPLAFGVGALSAATWVALTSWELILRPAAPAAPVPRAAAPPAAPPVAGPLADVEAAAARVQARLLAHDGVLAGALVELAAEAESVRDAARAAAARADAALALLATADLPARAAAVAEAERRAATAAPATAATLRAAAQRQAAALTIWRSLGPLAEGIFAELALAAATLDELDARAARLALEDPAAAPAAGDDLRAGLHGLSARLQGVERAAAQTLQELP